MKLRLALGALALSAIFAGLAQNFPQGAQAQPIPSGAPRLALVIGEAAYKVGPLSSAANDAGLIAQTLQQAGFDVTGAADLDQDGLRKTLREFLDKASSAGPDATVFVYLSGRGLQYEGENYLAPVEAAVSEAARVPLETVRLSDYLTPLSQMPLRARIVVLDAARANTFAGHGAPLAGGLALLDPSDGELIAFNAAPGSVAPNENTPYGAYAQALNEMMRQGGMPLDQAFDSVRLRVAQQTKGALVPWDESKLSSALALFARAQNAPPLKATADLRSRPIRDYSLDQAYAAALERDTIAAYAEFLADFPDSPYSARVRVLLAVRREALTWRRAWQANDPRAYWTYLRRYPRGPHAEDARLRLGVLHAEFAPPPQFAEMQFDVPPPIGDEDHYFHRPYVMFDDSYYGPPPPYVEFLPPPVYIEREPPPPPPHFGLLPLPLVAAPLLFAIPAVRHGLFQAPQSVQVQNPNAQQYYNERAARPPQPGAAPAPGAPQGGGPAPQQGNAPAPQAPVPQAGQRPGAPAAQQPHALPQPAQQPPGAPPAAHAAPPVHQAPLQAPAQNAPPAPQAPAGAPAGQQPHTLPQPAQQPTGAPPAAHAAPPVHQAPPQAPAQNAPPAPQPPAAHAAPPPVREAPVHEAPAAHVAPPPHEAPAATPHEAARPIHVAPVVHEAAPPPHVAPPPQPAHVAPPPQPAHLAPPQPARAEPPHAEKPHEPHEKPHCGAPGEPPCH